MNEYPRMLYRPGNGPSEIWGELVDTRIVGSAEEEREALRDGWLREPKKACDGSKRRRLIRARVQWIGKHWQFWISTTLAIAGVVAAFLAIK
jgi:hypothetical protein